MKKVLKYIMLLIATIICTSCDYDEHIDENTMIVTEEFKYHKNVDKSLFRIEYKSLNPANGLDIYVVSDKDAFEVGDKVKLVKNGGIENMLKINGLSELQLIDLLRTAIELAGDGGCNPWTHEEETSMREYLDYLEVHM